MTEIQIRHLETVAEMRMVEDLQKQIWGDDESEIVPLHMLTTVAHNGGTLLGAWDAEAEALVGFVFGFLGTAEANPSRLAAANLKHCSHMLGVAPEYRNLGVGYLLKLAQRDYIMKQGVRLMTWTYDPLESRNAHLNIARLGSICKTYLREVYGEMQDVLNKGLPSDRFQVDWWVTSQRAKQRASGSRRPLTLEQFTSAEAPILNPTRLNDSGLPFTPDLPAIPEGVFGLVEIPSDFQTLKAADLGLAREWKLQIRAIFEASFADGFIVTDFVHDTLDGRDRSFYVLSQGDVKLGGEE